jgi:hypothetical protein
VDIEEGTMTFRVHDLMVDVVADIQAAPCLPVTNTGQPEQPESPKPTPKPKPCAANSAPPKSAAEGDGGAPWAALAELRQQLHAALGS